MRSGHRGPCENWRSPVTPRKRWTNYMKIPRILSESRHFQSADNLLLRFLMTSIPQSMSFRALHARARRPRGIRSLHGYATSSECTQTHAPGSRDLRTIFAASRAMAVSRRIGAVMRHLAPDISRPQGIHVAEVVPRAEIDVRVINCASVAGVAPGSTPLLSAEDWKFWTEQGYLVIPDAVPLANCEAVRREMFATLGASEENPDSWYEAIKAKRSYQMFTTQGIWDNRSYPKVHRAFSELWRTEKLWVSFDGVGMRLPDRPDYDGGDGFMHWDLNEEQLRAGPSSGMRVQGVLMLADTPDNGGTFQCVPGFHRVLEDWVAGVDSHTLCNGGSRPAVPKMDSPAMAGFKVKRVGGRAGTLVIWNSFLPHGNSRNSSDVPRLCQCEF